MLKRLLTRTSLRITLPCLVALATCTMALPAAAAQAHEGEGPGLREVRIVAHDNGNDKSFQGSFSLPTNVPTGLVEVRFLNQGSEDHMAQFFRLNEGVSQEVFIQRLTPLFTSRDPAVIVLALHALLAISAAAGGADSITPGAEQDVIERLSPGHYVVVCFDTTANGTPHFLLGMAKSFWASDDASAPTDRNERVSDGAPHADGTILESDHLITVPQEITEHERLLLKVTVSDQTHEFQLLRVPDGTTAAELLQCFTGPPSGRALTAPPIDSGGAAAIAPGSTHWVELHLAPGTYAALCFVPDIETGMPHAFMGMITVFTVTK